MSRRRNRLPFPAAMMDDTDTADVPDLDLAVDIAPTYPLVACVMEGAGSPNLIVQTDAVPRGYSVHPSEAPALQEADLVFWTDEDLTSWMVDAVKNLAGNVAITTLPEAERATGSAGQYEAVPDGWTRLPDRLRPLFKKTPSRMAQMESETPA